MSLPPGFLDDLRSRVSLAQLVGRKVTWDQRKSNPGRGDYWAPCPFHQEKTASFHADDGKGYYYCFGCQAKGDAVSFLRETEGMGFMEAVEALAAQAGVEMPGRDPGASARAAAAAGLAEAMEAAVRFCRLQLATAAAAGARAYLERRGLRRETIELFEIGFAPAERTAMLDHLRGKGFAVDRLAEAGLVGLRDGGGAYDRFRGRIMFPIRDLQGRAIAFGARAIADGQEPKYLNSPETPLFDKGRNLYNARPAREAARKAGTLIVAEGYMDVIALAQAGIGHAVAPLGTAITEEQLRLIWKLCPEPVVALDGDRAGLAAAHRLTDLALPLLEPGRALRFALVPDGRDPDDVVREGGAAAFDRLVAESRPMIDLLWSRETEGAVLDSPERRAALDARLRAHLARIADPGLRAHYQSELRARRARLFAPVRRDKGIAGGDRPGRPGRDRAWRAAARAPLSPAAATRASPLAGPAAGTGAEARIRECAILAGCLNHPALAAEFEDRLDRMPFSSPDLGKIRDALLSALHEALHQPDPGAALGDAIGRRTGRNPISDLTAPGQVRANRYLAAGADEAQARRAIDEEITRHAALAGRAAEIAEAEREMTGAATEGLTWRLREAAQAAHQAGRRPLSESADAAAEAEAVLSAELQELIDRQIWRKPPKG
jgi:DNA primase